MKTFKNILYGLVIFSCTGTAIQLNGQSTVNPRFIRKQFNTPKIVQSYRLCENHAPHIQDEQLLQFDNGTFKIYNNSTGTLYPELYSGAILSSQSCILKGKDQWIFKREDLSNRTGIMKTTGFIPLTQYDSIRILEMDHFLGYKNGDMELFKYNTNTQQLESFHDVITGTLASPFPYDEGIFVRAEEDQKIYWLDLTTGAVKSDFWADSIYNFPTTFEEISIIKQGNEKFAYAFSLNQVVETEVEQFHFVPVYNYPLVVKNEYIAFGDDSWSQLTINNISSIDFEVYGDLVDAVITTHDHQKIIVDMWTKEVKATYVVE